ncbi:MAG: hypothetical protein ACKPFK_29885, partial [Dolichospermum sp.]
PVKKAVANHSNSYRYIYIEDMVINKKGEFDSFIFGLESSIDILKKKDEIAPPKKGMKIQIFFYFCLCFYIFTSSSMFWERLNKFAYVLD